MYLTEWAVSPIVAHSHHFGVVWCAGHMGLPLCYRRDPNVTTLAENEHIPCGLIQEVIDNMIHPECILEVVACFR